MKLMDRFRAAGDALRGKSAISVASQTGSTGGLGPWSGIANWFVPRQVNPHLFESMREAIPAIDGGINRLCTLDGIPDVEGDNDALVQEIKQWMDNVPVNDLQAGLQAFKDGIGSEQYEQGLGMGEFITDAKGRDIIGLRVADSKGINFRRVDGRFEAYYCPPAQMQFRGDGTDRVEQLLRGTYGAMSTTALVGAGFKPLNLANCIYTSINNEADNPYGTSIMRSMEFVSRILMTIENATEQTWNRLGDPPLHVAYKTNNRRVDGTVLDSRKAAIATELAATMKAKRGGNSAEFVTATGADDTITITVIGAQDKIIEIEMPARHVLEQIVAKLGLPSWMLGYHWSTAERLAESQSIIALQESQTRWARSKPAYTKLIETLLRLRGRTWKPGDWQVVQHLPNLADELKRAQAEFLRAQTVMMLSGTLDPNANVPDDEAEPAAKRLRHAIGRMSAKLTGMDAESRRKLLADPHAVTRVVDEAMGW